MPRAPLIMRRDWLRALNIAGSALSILGVVFVGLRLHTYMLSIDLADTRFIVWWALAFLAVVYGAATCLLALAWWHLLNYLGITTSRFAAINMYGISNLAKYVPGNIFHLAGRQAVGMAAGIPAKPLASSMLWELALIGFCGILFCLTMLPHWISGMNGQAGVILAGFFAVLGAVGLYKTYGQQVLMTYICQLLFLVISGSIFVAIVALSNRASGIEPGYWLPVGGAYIAAWFVGLVTPGAPAGVGVREMVLMFLLKSTFSEEILILPIIFGRMITVLGDLLFFLMAAFVAKISRK